MQLSEFVHPTAAYAEDRSRSRQKQQRSDVRRNRFRLLLLHSEQLAATEQHSDKRSLEEKRISQTHYDWLPKGFPMAHTFGYDLRPGTVVTFTELQAET
jgi:hypothetical protein